MKIISIIQVRMNSKRLPHKALMPILGKSLLQHVIEFLNFSKLTDKIIVATTTETIDNKIEELCKTLNVACFRGNSSDVLERYYECAKTFHGDLIVRITADNPLLDPNLVDKIIQICKDTNCDYATTMLGKTFPYGYLVEAITFPILDKLHKTKKDKLSREHVTYYLRTHPEEYKTEKLDNPSKIARPNWRLTVDYIEDLKLIKKIFIKLYKPKSFIKYESVVDFLDNNKHLLKINRKYNDQLYENI